MSRLILGIDGGGTKTIAWLAPLEDAANTIVLGRGQTGPGNPRAAGFEVAQENILAAIRAAFEDAQLPRATAIAACLALAGAGREGEQRQIESWAKEQEIAQSVRVCGDAEPILAAASPENCGIALICGTGSMAWGRNREGNVARSGGWGYLLGDEGSGYAVARAGLQAAVRAADGRGLMTSLLPLLLNELAATTPQELVERIYAPQMTRERLARLAHLVFDGALRDPVAAEIVAQAAEELAVMVAIIADRLELQASGYTLALTGGVMINELLLRNQVLNKLRDKSLSPGETAVIAEPVCGAVALARSLAI